MFEGIEYEDDGFGKLPMFKKPKVKGVKVSMPGNRFKVGKDIKKIGKGVGGAIGAIGHMFKGKKRIGAMKKGPRRLGPGGVVASAALSGIGEEGGSWTDSIKSGLNVIADTAKVGVGVKSDIDTITGKTKTPSYVSVNAPSKMVYYLAGGAALAVGAFFLIRK